MAAQAAAQYVDDATSELLLMPDWGKNIEVADLTADPDFGREVPRALRKRLANKNPKVVQLALTLYDTTVKNGGHVYHLSACSREMVTAIAALAEGKGPCTDPDVAAAAAALLQELAISFAPQASLFPWKFVMDQLSARGVRFPPIDPKAVLVFPVPADPLAGHAPSSSMASNATSGGGGGGGGWGAQGQPGSMPPPPGIGYGGASSRGTSPLMQPLQQHQQPQPNTGRGGGQQQQQRGSPATAPQPNNPDKLASQLAQVDRSFEKLRSDLQAVRAVVASTCRLAVSGQAALTNVAFLDSMDFLQQVPTRLAVLIEAGVAGALDEQLFEACLSVNDAVGRVLEACMPLLQPRAAAAAAAAGDVDLLSVSTPASSSSSSAFQQLSDLTSFDAPPPAAAAIGAGSGAGAAPSASGRNELSDLFGAASAPAASAAVPSPALRAVPVAAVTATTPFDSHPITSGVAASAPAAAGPAAASHVDDFFNTPPPSSSSSMASSSQAVPSSSAPALESAPVPVAPAHVDDGFASLPPSTSSLAAFDFDHPSAAPSASSAAAVGVALLPPPRAPAAPSAGNGSTTSSVLAELDSLI